MSPLMSHNRIITSSKSPASILTKVNKTSQSTAISVPSQKTVTEPSSSSTMGSSLSTAPTKSIKGASIISVPTARSYADMEQMEEVEEVGSSIASRKRAKGKQIRPRQQQLNTQIGEDGEEDVENGEEALPDYNNMYMYEFVKDLGVGRRSKAYVEQQEMFNQQQKVDKKEQRIRDIRILEGRGPSPQRELEKEEGEEEDELQAEDGNDDETRNKDEKFSFAKIEISTSKPSSAHKTFAPQVRVIDGRIELDMDSLTVDHAVVEAVENQGPMEYVEESSSTKFINSASFGKKVRSERWNDEETELFYKALSQWGTDFSIICRLFPSKTRIAVRNKYKREDRYNHSRIEEALSNRAPIDLEQYSQMTKIEFPEVSELDEVKKLSEENEGDDSLLPENGYEDEYGDEQETGPEEEIVEQEDDGEEIVGMVE
ncbi:hypothetical protein BC939DRAFT_477036 [Gamsiella multidivaricata]|uniref:uncharacterized protein n=1 Tax=Gamsiella multidivaricata TaxID=101098 RepID=UPI00221F9DDD|nr:uncharacterized protein BC939DRAFT_477036 [Gamsiella multidivaricata]KAI7823872.1 hypothetical protein BC939DRAFT_477036 [Gamsiella multidivaricata]